jgi:signal transduction histidine kinase
LVLRPDTFIVARARFGGRSWKKMVASATANDHVVSLFDVPPTSRQRAIIFAIAAVLLVAFALTAPFARVQLPEFVSFNPSVESVVFVNDLVTAILLFSQYAITRARAVLALAVGYLYTALIVVPHILSFPGSFTGLLGAGNQTSAWLYYFWSAGLPAAVTVYVLLADAHRASRLTVRSTQSAISWSVVLVICLVVAIAWLTTAGERFLPILVADNKYSFTTVYLANPLAILLAALAFTLLWLRRRSVLDYWLWLAMLSLILNYVVAAFLATQRYSLGFYASRGYTLVTSMIVLALLLKEMTNLYTRLARSNLMLERERSNKLMNIEATTAAIAHEVKQPLTAIVVNANAGLSIVEKQPSNVAEIRETFSDIAADGRRIGETLDAIRALFRTTTEQEELIDINQLALEVLRSMRGQLSEHEVVALPELTAAVPHIRGNRGQLREVIFNLVQNAVEAMSAGDRKRVLRLITERGERDTIVVAVQDSGPGIPAERLGETFDAFVTTKSQGMGLGLAISRMIVERHGGQLSAHSDGKNGALFQFVLPIRPIKPEANRGEPSGP